jgi:hypothetical protein
MHRDAFDDVITNGNSKGWFKAGQPLKVVQLKRLQLLRDVRTRWDSEYYMLNRLCELCPVHIFASFDSDYGQTISNMTGSRLLPRSPE